MDYVWFLFSFEGRINRAKFWLALLVILCWMILLGALTAAISSLLGGPTSLSFAVTDIFRIVDPEAYRSLSSAGLVAAIKATGTALFTWVYFATAIKRLHDRDKSGWWIVPFFVLPGLYNQFADRLGDSYLLLPPALAAFVLCIWGFVEMFFLTGSRTTNRFGPNPLVPIDTGPRWDQQSEIEMVPHKAGPPQVWHVKREA